MRWASVFRIWAVLAVLTVFVQAATLAHAAANGDAPHDHNGIACDLGAVVSEQAAIVPPVPVSGFVLATPPQFETPIPANQTWRRPPGRAPPPRGPPSIIQ